MKNEVEKVIKQVVQHRRGIPGVLDPHDVVVSMFTVEGKEDFFIGWIRPDGSGWSPYHSGQKRYIERVWKKRFEK